MIQLKNTEEISLIGESGRLLTEAFREVGELIEPGVKTRELDAFCHDFIVTQKKPAGAGIV